MLAFDSHPWFAEAWSFTSASLREKMSSSTQLIKFTLKDHLFSKQIRVAALNIEQQGENALEKLSGCCLLAPEQ